jgi:hypothetical protein
MRYRALLSQSKAMLKHNPEFISGLPFGDIFYAGAKWMHNWMNEMDDRKTVFNYAAGFGAYGLFKYSCCVAAMTIAALLLYKVNVLLTPLSIIVFYFFEVQLLFLFPLLIDNVKNPLWVSMQQTYQIGIFKAIINVIPISIYMVIGLFNTKAPFRNWHTGSLAIVIWYQYEIRNRVR